MDDSHAPDYGHPHGWKFLLMAELRQVAIRRPWGPALMAIGGVHLTFFLICQTIYTAGVRAHWPSVLLWSTEVAAVLAVLRLVAGQGWIREAPVVGLIVRVWITFLILSFNVASLNTFTGFSLDWFKPVWCTLASFGFATMAWLFGYRYLIPAFQMYFTGLLMVYFSEWNYLIHGLSWCAALQWIGWDVSKRRERLLAASSPFPSTSGPDHNQRDQRKDDPTGAAPMSHRKTGLAALGLGLLLAPSTATAQVAFVPNVGVFPNGVTFSTTPVVSADRRYVRLGVNPQFNALEGFNTSLVPAAVTGGGLRNVDAGMMPGMAFGMDGPVGYGAGPGFLPYDSADASAALSGGLGVVENRRSRFGSAPAPRTKATTTKKAAKTKKGRTTH